MSNKVKAGRAKLIDVWAVRLQAGQRDSLKDIMDHSGCRTPSALLALLVDEHFELKRIKLSNQN